jgi:hypothetical protein
MLIAQTQALRDYLGRQHNGTPIRLGRLAGGQFVVRGWGRARPKLVCSHLSSDTLGSHGVYLR